MNFYDYLGVKSTASEVEIKKAFRRLAKQKHPDHNNKDTAFWDMVELNLIRDTLLDSDKRREYDKSLAHSQNKEFLPPQETVPSQKNKKASSLYNSVRSLFVFRCRKCGIEMSSTWQGYCLLHYLEASEQLNNPENTFEYAGHVYHWQQPEEEQHTHTQAIRIKPIHIISYSTLILVIMLYLGIIALQLLK